VTAVARASSDARGLLGLDGIAPDLADLALDIKVSSPVTEGSRRGNAGRLARALPDLPGAPQAELDRAHDRGGMSDF
jgi:hypothetical protein